MSIKKYRLPYSEAAVQDLQRRLAASRWPEPVADSILGGICPSVVRRFCTYWKDEFDWKAQIEKLSALPHYFYSSNGAGIHFIHERGKGPNPIPLIITHGWPGSFLEMLKLIPMLTDPVAHGGDQGDSFDVVVPSLPGYGFSAPWQQVGTNNFRIAELWVTLMQHLGYKRFAAQGGDIGAGVSTVLGWKYPERIIGIHLNYIPGSFQPYIPPSAKLSDSEHEFRIRIARWRDEEGAYSHMQATRPLTASYGLNDSPAGLAAWILEKFRDWSDCSGDLDTRFTMDELLTNVTLYWMTQTIHSSFRLYYENRRAPLVFGEGESVSAPCAIARFPKEIPCPPREWVERAYNVRRWTEFPRGGHFAAMEEPEMFAADIRAFLRPLRN